MKIKAGQYVRVARKNRSGLDGWLHIRVVDIIGDKLIVSCGAGIVFEIPKGDVVAIVKPPEHHWETWSVIEEK